jgi:hypothetical protein
MARPHKIDSLEQFLATEVRIAGNISEGNMKMLRREGLWPEPLNPADGKAGFSIYGARAVYHSSIIAAIWSGGVELVAAARIAKEIIDGFTFGDIFDSRRAREAIISDEVLDGDFFLTVVDRQYAFMDRVSPKHRVLNVQQPGFQIRGWERGGAMEITPIHSQMPEYCINPDDEFGRDPHWHSELERIEREFRDARRKAVALLQINLSLACRNGFAAIYANRAQRQSPRSTSPILRGDDAAPLCE